MKLEFRRYVWFGGLFDNTVVQSYSSVMTAFVSCRLRKSTTQYSSSIVHCPGLLYTFFV